MATKRIERIIRLYNRLRRGPVTIEIISKWAKQAGIILSDRQLYRDLNELQHLRFAEGENVIEFIDEKNKKTWKLEYDAASETVTQYDINSFFLFKNFVPYCIIGERKESFEKFEQFIYQQLSHNKYQKLINANELYLRNTTFHDYFYSDTEQQKIEDIIWALQNKRKIIISASVINPTNVNEKKFPFPLIICPLELLFHRGRIVVAGIEPQTKKLIIYSVERSLEYNLSNELFDRNQYLTTYREQLDMRFGITEPIGNKIYHIRIEWTGGYAESMKNFRWHPSQQWRKLKNGNYVLELHCSIGREMIGWLASGLDKVKVYQPKILRDLLLKKMKQTVDVYEKDLMINEDLANGDY
ncbi:MAG TPA: WYL domain-containing protein [Chitinophagaceae bacterium]|nr:WYL domain-containing protein [Chitinophagaceae bacterium]